MGLKGPSYRYGNTRGSAHKGIPSSHINYQWAKDFNKRGLEKHFLKHGKEFCCSTSKDYTYKAIKFANTVDRKNFKSVVDYRGTTYKYNPSSKTLVEVDKKGYIISYRQYNKHFSYQIKKGVKVWIN